MVQTQKNKNIGGIIHMSKSLKSMTPEERLRAIERRLRENKGGLGYLAAVDAKKKMSAK